MRNVLWDLKTWTKISLQLGNFVTKSQNQQYNSYRYSMQFVFHAATNQQLLAKNVLRKMKTKKSTDLMESVTKF